MLANWHTQYGTGKEALAGLVRAKLPGDLREDSPSKGRDDVVSECVCVTVSVGVFLVEARKIHEEIRAHHIIIFFVEECGVWLGWPVEVGPVREGRRL